MTKSLPEKKSKIREWLTDKNPYLGLVKDGESYVIKANKDLVWWDFDKDDTPDSFFIELIGDVKTSDTKLDGENLVYLGEAINKRHVYLDVKGSHGNLTHFISITNNRLEANVAVEAFNVKVSEYSVEQRLCVYPDGCIYAGETLLMCLGDLDGCLLVRDAVRPPSRRKNFVTKV